MNEDVVLDILIVDDTPQNLRILSAFLSGEGYHVRQALNGPMALKAVQVALPELILLDVMMPEMDGYEVCEHLKADPQTAQIPVIFLSALNEGMDKVRAFAVGAADYITKPFQFEEVLIRVQNQLALRAAKQQTQRLNAELEARVRERTHQLELANQHLQQEIHERRQLQDELLRMALHDALTGLPNRTLLIDRLQASLMLAMTHPQHRFAVLFLDCDRFKVVNDSLGHLVGDELLQAIAHRLKSCLRPADTLARMGGDEFAILLSHITQPDDAVRVAQQILDQFAQPFQLERYEVFINASIGIVVGDRHYEKPEYLLRDADTAMYRAKANGRGQYRLFDPAMHEAALTLIQLETELRRAIHHGELCVYYQPIMNLSTGMLAGFEALVRWQHPQRGMITPDTFIPLAEETGLIV